jgi:hypothetical protein
MGTLPTTAHNYIYTVEDFLRLPHKDPDLLATVRSQSTPFRGCCSIPQLPETSGREWGDVLGNGCCPLSLSLSLSHTHTHVLRWLQ